MPASQKEKAESQKASEDLKANWSKPANGVEAASMTMVLDRPTDRLHPPHPSPDDGVVPSRPDDADDPSRPVDADDDDPSHPPARGIAPPVWSRANPPATEPTEPARTMVNCPRVKSLDFTGKGHGVGVAATDASTQGVNREMGEVFGRSNFALTLNVPLSQTFNHTNSFSTG